MWCGGGVVVVICVCFFVVLGVVIGVCLLFRLLLRLYEYLNASTNELCGGKVWCLFIC